MRPEKEANKRSKIEEDQVADETIKKWSKGGKLV